MEWLELMWNIASMWALCAGCLMIFVAVLKAQSRDTPGGRNRGRKQNENANIAPPHGI